MDSGWTKMELLYMFFINVNASLLYSYQENGTMMAAVTIDVSQHHVYSSAPKLQKQQQLRGDNTGCTFSESYFNLSKIWAVKSGLSKLLGKCFTIPDSLRIY